MGQRTRRRWVAPAALALAACMVVGGSPATIVRAGEGGTNLGQTNLAYTGYVQDATAPAGAKFAKIIAQGAGGGAGMALQGTEAQGGRGALIVGYLPVEVGDTLQVAVGQMGQTTPNDPIVGGWGNGADGGNGTVSVCTGGSSFVSYGGGGGGATTVKMSGKTIVVAAGGGGAGGSVVDCANGQGLHTAGAGGDAGPTPQDGETAGPNTTGPIFGGKAGASTNSAGLAGGGAPAGDGGGGGGGGGVNGGGGGNGNYSDGATTHGVGGGGGGAGTSIAAGLAGVTQGVAREPADGLVSITWYSDVDLSMNVPSTVPGGTVETFDVTLTDPDGGVVHLGSAITLATSEPTDKINGDEATLSKIGPRTITATFGTASVQATLSVVAGPPVALVPVLPAFAYAGDTITASAYRIDAGGNAVGQAVAPLFTTDGNDHIFLNQITFAAGVSRTATVTAIEPYGNISIQGSAQMKVTADFAYQRPVTASSSLEAFGFGAQQLTDGATSSSADHHGFSTDPADPSQQATEWVTVDFGTYRSIGGVVISPRTAVAPETGVTGAGYPQDFSVDLSLDGTTWTTAAVYANQDGHYGPHTYRFANAVTGRYLRVNATLLGPFAEGDDGFRLQLAGLQAYADPAVPADASVEMDMTGSQITTKGLDAYGVPTGTDLNCFVQVTSSVATDKVLPPTLCAIDPFVLVTDGIGGPRTITATLIGNPSVTGSIVYNPLTDLRALPTLTATTGRVEYGKSAAVHVSLTADQTPSGRVRVREGQAELARADLAGGTADLAIGGPGLKPGRHVLMVDYFGTTDHRAVTQELVVNVNKASVTLQAAIKTVRVVNHRTTATIRVEASSAVEQPTGSVSAVHRGHVIGKGTLKNGVAIVKLTGSFGGSTAPITIRYGGDDVHARAAGDVERIPTTVDVRTAQTHPAGGQVNQPARSQVDQSSQKATIAIRVRAVRGTPTGLVQARWGGRILGTAQIRKGTATLTLTTDGRPGTRVITIRYLGSPTHQPSATTIVLVPRL